MYVPAAQVEFCSISPHFFFSLLLMAYTVSELNSSTFMMSSKCAAVFEIPISSNGRDKVLSYICFGYCECHHHQQVFISNQRVSNLGPTILNEHLMIPSSFHEFCVVLVFLVSFFNQNTLLIYVKPLTWELSM